MSSRKIFLIILISAFVEAILNFRIFYVRPELILLTLVFFSLKVNLKEAFALGCFAGFLKDIISISPFGLHILFFALAASLINWSKKFFYEIPDYLSIIAAGIALFFYSLIFVLAKISSCGLSLTTNIIFYAFLVILINILISPLVFKLLRKCA